jgi:hypothetical protein
MCGSLMDVLFGLAGSLLLVTGVGWLAWNLLRLRTYSKRVEGTVSGFTVSGFNPAGDHPHS